MQLLLIINSKLRRILLLNIAFFIPEWRYGMCASLSVCRLFDSLMKVATDDCQHELFPNKLVRAKVCHSTFPASLSSMCWITFPVMWLNLSIPMWLLLDSRMLHIESNSFLDLLEQLVIATISQSSFSIFLTNTFK